LYCLPQAQNEPNGDYFVSKTRVGNLRLKRPIAQPPKRFSPQQQERQIDKENFLNVVGKLKHARKINTNATNNVEIVISGHKLILVPQARRQMIKAYAHCFLPKRAVLSRTYLMVALCVLFVIVIVWRRSVIPFLVARNESSHARPSLLRERNQLLGKLKPTKIETIKPT
jgi:hypothetical protein